MTASCTVNSAGLCCLHSDSKYQANTTEISTFSWRLVKIKTDFPLSPFSAPGPPQLWIPGPQVKKPHEEGWKDQPPPRAVLESLQKAVWAEGWHGIPTQKGIFTVGNKNKGGRPTAWALVRKQDFPYPFGNTLPPGWGPASLSPAQEAEPLDSGLPHPGRQGDRQTSPA